MSAAPATAPRRTSEVLRIIRGPFHFRFVPTMGRDRRESRPCETRRREPVGSSPWGPWRRFAEPASHHGHGFPGQHELAEIDGYPFHPRKQHMIPAAGIQDQELPVGAERTGINHPSVARRRHLGAGAGGDGEPLLGAAEPSDAPKSRMLHAVDRHRQHALGGREGDAGASGRDR